MEANNMKSMRDALELVLRFLQWMYAQEGENAAISRVQIADEIDRVISALSAPPRQCDIGTVEEQKERFDAFCNAQPQKRGYCNCILQKNRQGLCEGLCEFAWAQMLYKAEGDDDGNV